MAGVKALSDYDAGLTGGYLNRAEALLELAIECAHERHRGDWSSPLCFVAVPNNIDDIRCYMDRLRRFVEALRVLAQTNDPNRVVLIENAINEYLRDEPGNVRISLERLCDAIDREEAENRRGEDWSIARDYVRARLRRLA
jgi:hypothetical protein